MSVIRFTAQKVLKYRDNAFSPLYLQRGVRRSRYAGTTEWTTKWISQQINRKWALQRQESFLFLSIHTYNLFTNKYLLTKEFHPSSTPSLILLYLNLQSWLLLNSFLKLRVFQNLSSLLCPFLWHWNPERLNLYLHLLCGSAWSPARIDRNLTQEALPIMLWNLRIWKRCTALWGEIIQTNINEVDLSCPEEMQMNLVVTNFLKLHF